MVELLLEEVLHDKGFVVLFSCALLVPGCLSGHEIGVGHELQYDGHR